MLSAISVAAAKTLKIIFFIWSPLRGLSMSRNHYPSLCRSVVNPVLYTLALSPTRNISAVRFDRTLRRDTIADLLSVSCERFVIGAIVVENPRPLARQDTCLLSATRQYVHEREAPR